jgi:hypothetical protein
MEDDKPTVKLWSTKEGQLLDFIVTIENGEVVCKNGDEFIKFPGALKPTEFRKLVKAHNKANEGVVAISSKEIEADEARDRANELLLKSLQ